jgi:cyclic-di-GMP-binding protein
MLTLPLEPTNDSADPAFKNAAECAKWLGQLQLTNLHLAHGVLRTQLNESNFYPMAGHERLQTLEILRETVASVQADYAKKLIAKKLPLNEDEYTLFSAIIGMWQSMVTGYQRCLHAYMAGDKALAPYGALLCQRCLLYSGRQIFEHQRTGYEFDGRLWHQLHALYAFSEEKNIQLDAVNDELCAGRQSSCHAMYTKTLLACSARPSEMTRTQLQLLDRWLTLWSPSINVERSCSTSKDDAPPLAVDLNSMQGLQPAGQAKISDSVRYLAMQPLSKLLRVKIILLQQGKSPQQLELGTGCNSADCADFLNHLLQCWCEGRGARMAERRSTTQQAKICHGLNEIYAHIANKPFEQPGRATGVNTVGRRQIEAFGRVLPGESNNSLAEMGFALEDWQIMDESVLGARLLRENLIGARVGQNQLIAVLHSNANAFMLSTVRWVHVTQSGQLHAGVRYMPSVPQAISMRSGSDSKPSSEKYVAALLLPTVSSLKIPASLVVPRDWFQPGRVVEIMNLAMEKEEVQMGFSVEKGPDFERVSFTPI